MKRTFTVVIAALTMFFHTMAANAQQPSTTDPEERTSAPPPATVTGSGTANYIPLWTGASTLGNSKLYQTGGRIGVGTTAPTVALDVNGRVNASKAYRIQGYDFLTAPGGPNTLEDTGVGVGALSQISTGFDNTGVGYTALTFDTEGAGNTAVGAGALFNNEVGAQNTAIGWSALYANLTGIENTAIGVGALQSNNGSENAAFGVGSLTANTTGGNNTAYGWGSLPAITTGSFNTAVGYAAGLNLGFNDSNNIDIGSPGIFGDNGVIRIGQSGYSAFFAAGVRGVTTGLADAVPVVVDSNGQLGTVSSSRRFKEDIHDMGQASEGLMRLRPVAFRYQKPFADGSKPLQYGLIAEEVAEVYPDLVTHSADGQIETVKYQVLDSMLLNEVQKQRGTIQQQQAEIDALKEKVEKLEAALVSISGAR